MGKIFSMKGVDLGGECGGGGALFCGGCYESPH